jgi:RNA polymerase sigma factor (sigma-70 family)
MKLYSDPESGKPIIPARDQALQQGYSESHADHVARLFDEDVSELPKPIPYGSKDARPWVAYYQELDPDHEGTELSRTQEQAIMERIQIGIAAREQLPEDIEDSSLLTVEQRLDYSLHLQGEIARQALFESNMRFAKYYARESVGIGHPKVQAALSTAASRSQSGRSAGTYKPLRSLKSPYADLEHREQSALEALWKLTGTAKPGSKGRFIAYAAWNIQQTIERDMGWEEHNTIRLTDGMHGRLGSYLRDWSDSATTPGTDEELERLIALSERVDFPDDLPTRVEGGIAELNDPYNEDDVPTELAEVWADERVNIESSVDRGLARAAIQRVLDDTLSERESGVIGLRFGIEKYRMHSGSKSANSHSEYTLDEIGDVFGVTRERIRQIESKTMAKLRHPARSEKLKDHAHIDEPERESSEYIRIPTESYTAHTPHSYYEKPVGSLPGEREYDQTGRAGLEAWQLFAGERWDDPVRILPEGITEEEYREKIGKLIEAIDGAESWHFDTRTDAREKRPYSMGLMNRLEKIRGETSLSTNDVELIWDIFMQSGFKRLEEKLGKNMSYDRVGKFFSAIIENSLRLESDWPLTLRIPEEASGKINYLASRLTRGDVTIIGNPGNYVGFSNSGLTHVEVAGDVGNYAGAYLRDFASVHASGKAGYSLGIGSKDNAWIKAESAGSISGEIGDDVSVEITSRAA